MLRVILETAVILVGETLVAHVQDLIAEEQLPPAALATGSSHKDNCSLVLEYLDNLMSLPCPETPLIGRLRRSLTLGFSDLGLIGRCRAAVKATELESDCLSAPQTASWLWGLAVLLGAFDLSGACLAASAQLSSWKVSLESKHGEELQLMVGLDAFSPIPNKKKRLALRQALRLALNRLFHFKRQQNAFA